MFDVDRLAAFVVTATLITLAPGPDILQVVARGAAYGRRSAVAAALGFAAGNLVHTLLAVVGLSAVIAASPFAFRCMQWTGAAYLALLGMGMLRPSGGTRIGVPAEFRRGSVVFRQCLLANVLNPKVAIFFVALLPQFVVRSQGRAPLQMAFLGGIFTLVVVVCFTVAALAASLLGERLAQNSGMQRALGIAAGVVLIGLAVHLAFSDRAPLPSS